VGGNGDQPGQFKGPYSLTLDGSGTVYVVETTNTRVQRFTSDGTFIEMWGSRGAAAGQFNGPEGIAVGPDGTVYVMDTFNYRVQSFTPHGQYLGEWPLNRAATWVRIAADGHGRIYCVDNFHNCVFEFSSAGSPIAQLGEAGSGPGQFLNPIGIAVDLNGNVYVADTNNFRIEVFGWAATAAVPTSWGHLKALYR
jgi:DNA-binding beta-propeller fold protein YncE